LQPGVGEAAQDVALGAVVDGDNVILGLVELAVALAQRPLGLVPIVGLLRRDLDGEVHAVEAGPLLGNLAHRRNVELAVGGVDHDTVGRTAIPDTTRDGAGIDVAYTGQIVALQPVIERLDRAPVGGVGDVAADDHTSGSRRDRLDIFEIGADISDMRKCEGDDLPGVRRIGDDLLVAGHRGIEADFADRMAGGPDAFAPENRAVSQHQRGRGPARRGVGRACGLWRCHDELFARS
jgi:hypothetical protein